MKKASTVVTVCLAVMALVAWLMAAEPGLIGYYPPYPSTMTALAVTLSVAACLGWLMLWLSPAHHDNETRCRQCGYILRGITEPRCPECGERI